MAYSSTKPADGASLVSADIRENFRALKEDDIVEGVAALGVVEGMLAASSVTQAKLKTSQGSVSGGNYGGGDYTLPGGEYGFYPQLKGDDHGVISASLANDLTSVTYVTNITFAQSGGDHVVYAQQRYVTSSGEVFWIFILRDKITKEVKAMYQAPDHPCFGNGGKPLLVSHPFGSYDPETQEIIVINPSEQEVTEMKGRCERGEDEPDKDLLEIITEEYEIDEKSEPKWPSIPVTVGLPKDYEMKAMGTEVTSIKKVIPQPNGILAKMLRRK